MTAANVASYFPIDHETGCLRFATAGIGIKAIRTAEQSSIATKPCPKPIMMKAAMENANRHIDAALNGIPAYCALNHNPALSQCYGSNQHPIGKIRPSLVIKDSSKSLFRPSGLLVIGDVQKNGCSAGPPV